MVRTPTGETPCKMAFRTEVVVPVEIGVSSIRRAWYDEGLKLALNCLPEVRDDAAQRMSQYQQRMSKYHE